MENKLPRYYRNLDQELQANKVLVIFGPRQVGKTTLLRRSLNETPLKYKFVSGDDIQVQTVLSSQQLEVLKEYVEGYDLLVIDEAQKIPKIGVNLKMLVDHVQGIKIIVTGSASFELAGQVGEPLTGRKKTLQLFPFAQLELKSIMNRHELKESLEKFLIYGSYPEVIVESNKAEKQRYLNIYANNYFWRTWDQQEIDLIEEREGKLFGYEFKWNKKIVKPPHKWISTYENSTFEVINRENYLEFII